MRLSRTIVGLGVVAALLGGCNGDDEPEGPPKEVPFDLVAVDNEFEPDDLTVPSGRFARISFSNQGENPHTFVIDDVTETPEIPPGGEATLSFPLPDPGTTLEFYCRLHDGMEGTLTVN